MLWGLFIGIDRYRAPVTRLSCSRADAVALASLFGDSLPGDIAQLLDDEATLDRIRTEVSKLSQAAGDDFVVVSFSGHGTETHELVPVDVDPLRITETCLPLTELAELLDAIPAKHLLVILDCCFSGGFGGARVFASQSTRDMFEDRASVEALVHGQGRLVLTASSAGEPALETMQYGHGLLTYYLLKGLQGQAGLASGGRISVLDLLNYAMRQVGDAAKRLQADQTPTLYGSIEGAPTLPVLTPGPLYATAFPDRVCPPATAEWSSLVPYGLAPAIIEAWVASMPGLNELQQTAINNFGVLGTQSLLVVAPTGSGKTMIGELAALHAVSQGARAVMLLPLKALVNDKYDYLTRVYGDTIAVAQATGDNSDQAGAIVSGQYELAILTYEKFLNLMLVNPHIMRGISVVIVDEVQTVADPSRGPALEFLLTLLRAGHGRGGAPQIVALSAVIGDTQGLERWLGGGLLQSTHRPVPLREHVVLSDGGLHTLEADGTETTTDRFFVPAVVSGSQSNKPWVIPLVQKLVGEGKKVVVFRATRGDAVGTAQYLGNALGLPPATDVIEQLPQADASISSVELRSALSNGVGFHNSDLSRAERLALEAGFRDPDGPLRVLAATTTLAMGINTPADAVVIAGLNHPGSGPYSVAEYKNMAGRAGRLGHRDSGDAYIVAGDIGPAAAWQHYIMGEPEDVTSQFLAVGTDPQTLALRCVVALGASVEEQALLELLEGSFALWRQAEQGLGGLNAAALRSDLEALVQAHLLDREPDGKLTLTDLGRYAGQSGIEVRSVTRVASALRGAPAELSVGDLITLAQVTVEVDAINMRVHNKSTKERAEWPGFLSRWGVSPGLIRMLHVGGGNPTLRAKKAAACLLYIGPDDLNAIENFLMSHVRERSAAGPIRQVAARTRDVIDAVAEIAGFYGCPFGGDSSDVGLQLEVGIPDEMMEIGRNQGARLTRGDYLALLRAGCTTWDTVDVIETDRLTALLGPEAAKRLKQVAPAK